MRNIYKYIITCICACFIQPSSTACTNHIPPKINDYSSKISAVNNTDVTVYYITKIDKLKIYHIYFNKKGIIYNGLPWYIAYDGKNIRKLGGREDLEIIYKINKHIKDVRLKKYKKLEHKQAKNIDKTMEIIDNTQPPNIPPAIKKYADKYMYKVKNRSFLYLTDINGQHVYRTYWPGYPFHLHPSGIILYDGQTIRRPTIKEYKEMHSVLQDALFKRLNALAHLENED